jgi:hypothetical protein
MHFVFNKNDLLFLINLLGLLLLYQSPYKLSIYLSMYLSTYLYLYSFLFDLGRFFNFLIFFRVGTTRWTGDQPVARPLPTYRTTQTQNKCTQTTMP